MTRYIPTVGMEVHVELATRTKMFCSCPHPTAATEPNQAVCPTCLGLPGTLPVVNAGAARMGLRAACALHCKINPTCRFERKNYQYPDLVKGYQISQYAMPIGEWGYIDIPGEELDDTDIPNTPEGGLRVAIRRTHLEEDTAKLVHIGGRSMVDANRSSAPLLEIVTDPVFHSARSAEAYVRRLRALLVFHGVSRCRIENGEMRVEANVSIAPAGSTEYGTRCEIKNQAGFNHMAQAIRYEIRRHTEILDAGGRVLQETRGFNPETGETFSQRLKEDAHDYRYFPDPDLPAPVVPDAWIAAEKAFTAESPDAFMTELGNAGVPAKTVEAVIRQDALGLLRATLRAADARGCVGDAPAAAPARVAQRLANDVFALANRAGVAMADCALPAAAFARTLALSESGKLTADGMKSVLDELFRRGGDADEVIARLGAANAHDDAAGVEAVEAVMAEHPEWVADFRSGKTTVRNALFGAVMKRLARKGDPKAIGALLDDKLKG